MFVTASPPPEVDASVGLAELRAHLGAFINEAHYRGGVITICRSGRPVAVLIGAAEYDRLSSDGAAGAPVPAQSPAA